METTAPGLHDAILLCAGIAAVYLVVAVMQLLQLKRRPKMVDVREPSLGLRPLDEAVFSPDTDKSFATWLKRSNIEAELHRLHLEIEQMRSDLNAAQNEIRQIRDTRASPSVVPQYNDAMSFAKGGLSATGIASRCGISLGEAELVAALARTPSDCIPADEALRKPAVRENNERYDRRYRAAA